MLLVLQSYEECLSRRSMYVNPSEKSMESAVDFFEATLGIVHGHGSMSLVAQNEIRFVHPHFDVDSA